MQECYSRYGPCDRCSRIDNTVHMAINPKDSPNGVWIRIPGVHLCRPCYFNHRDDPDVIERASAFIVIDPDPPDPPDSLREHPTTRPAKRPWWKFW